MSVVQDAMLLPLVLCCKCREEGINPVLLELFVTVDRCSLVGKKAKTISGVWKRMLYWEQKTSELCSKFKFNKEM